jgi:hypothetical protein
MNVVKDLSQEPPRSPKIHLGGYALMGRMIDKGRADLQGKAGEYHFACPLDQMLFEFKGVKAEEVKQQLATGASDEQVTAWFNTHGAPKKAEEIKAWSSKVEGARPYENPEKKEWFSGECAKLGLKPENTTLFQYLDADDIATFKK